MNASEDQDARDEDEPLIRLLALARNGDASALGRLLEAFRDQLRVQAQQDLPGDLEPRIDASDIVQRTCFSAVRHLDEFRGEHPREFLGWLRQIQRRNLVDEVRKHTATRKRNAARELTGESGVSPSRYVSNQSTPSRLAERDEETQSLEAAIENLPEMQAKVIRLKHLQGLQLSEIARRIGRSEQAVAGLLRRGLRQLRQQLDVENERF
jgi:RNA polymerase sigma-70 factor (ECF subfamily)